MAKKPELLEKAKKLKLDVTHKNTIAEIEAAIYAAEALLKPEYYSTWDIYSSAITYMIICRKIEITQYNSQIINKLAYPTLIIVEV